DRIRFTENFQLFPRDAPGAADRKARSRERMATDKAVRQAKFFAEQANFILEQFAQRLDQLHLHTFRQATDIVVRLDRDRRSAGEGNAFDHIRIKRALHEEVRAAQLLGFFLKHFDEETSNRLALLFRIGFAFQCADEAVGSIYKDQWQIVMFTE